MSTRTQALNVFLNGDAAGGAASTSNLTDGSVAAVLASVQVNNLTPNRIVITDAVKQLTTTAAISQAEVTNLTTDLAAKIPLSQKGAALGVAPLNALTKIDPAYIDFPPGSLAYRGTWDASTNTPVLNASTPTGDLYLVAAAGNTVLPVGVTDFQVGDWVIKDAATFVKLENVSGAENNWQDLFAPTATDDESKNYAPGSLWLFDGDVYICQDASVGAAVWQNTNAAGLFLPLSGGSMNGDIQMGGNSIFLDTDIEIVRGDGAPGVMIRDAGFPITILELRSSGAGLDTAGRITGGSATNPSWSLGSDGVSDDVVLATEAQKRVRLRTANRYLNLDYAGGGLLSTTNVGSVSFPNASITSVKDVTISSVNPFFALTTDGLSNHSSVISLYNDADVRIRLADAPISLSLEESTNRAILEGMVLDMGGNDVINAGSFNGVDVSAVETTAADALQKDGSVPMTGPLNANYNRIDNVGLLEIASTAVEGENESPWAVYESGGYLRISEGGTGNVSIECEPTSHQVNFFGTIVANAVAPAMWIRDSNGAGDAATGFLRGVDSTSASVWTLGRTAGGTAAAILRSELATVPASVQSAGASLTVSGTGTGTISSAGVTAVNLTGATMTVGGTTFLATSPVVLLKDSDGAGVSATGLLRGVDSANSLVWTLGHSQAGSTYPIKLRSELSAIPVALEAASASLSIDGSGAGVMTTSGVTAVSFPGAGLSADTLTTAGLINGARVTAIPIAAGANQYWSTAVGNGALSTHTGPLSGFGGMTALGYRAAASAPANSGEGICIGYQAGENSTNVYQAVFIGANAGRNCNGPNCVAIGAGALSAATVTDSSMAIGTNSLRLLAAGNTNMALGSLSLQALTSGSNNTGIGANSLQSLTTGSSNIAIGAYAGISYNAAESNNCLIAAGGGTAGESNVVRVGHTSHTALYLCGVQQDFSRASYARIDFSNFTSPVLIPAWNTTTWTSVSGLTMTGSTLVGGWTNEPDSCTLTVGDTGVYSLSFAMTGSRNGGGNTDQVQLWNAAAGVSLLRVVIDYPGGSNLATFQGSVIAPLTAGNQIRLVGLAGTAGQYSISGFNISVLKLAKQ